MTAAETILAQLGGNRFLAMTGAQCLTDVRSLTIKLPKISKLSCVVITLDLTTDTYIFQGYKGRGVRIAQNGQPIYQLHAEQLRETFTSNTGLAVSL